MRKKLVIGIAVLSMVGLVGGCGNKGTDSSQNANAGEETTEETSEEAVTDVGASDETPVMMVSPMQDSTEEEIKAETGAVFTIPAGAENVSCFMYRIDGGDFGEVQFTYSGADCNLRVQKTDEFTDISGSYYDWNLIEEGTLGDCVEQNMEFAGDGEYVHASLWHDSANGIMYSLTASETAATDFNIMTLASEVAGLSYANNDGGEMFMPNDFLQEREGKSTFRSYEEMIGCLQPGEGYGYVTLDGYNGDILVISDAVYDGEEGKVGLTAYFYAVMGDQSVQNIGNAFSNGTAYPIRCDGHSVYMAGNHGYECDVLTEGDYPALMVLETISEVYNNDGDEAVAEYYGFIRQSNDINDDGEDVNITTQEEFYAYVDKYLAADAIVFTVVE